MSQKQKTFLRYIHNFRGLAILLIVVGHLSVFFIDEPIDGLPIIYTILKNGSTYFIFIAGFLFQFLSKKYNYTSYLKNKLFNVVLPYILISIPAIILCLFKNEPYYPSSSFTSSFSEWPLFYKVIILYITGGHFFHFWFMPMIFLFYLFSPLFIWLDKNPKCYRILPLLICLSVIIPRPQDDLFIFQNFVHFIPTYILGMFCCHYQDDVLIFMKKYWQSALLISVFLITLEIGINTLNLPSRIFYFNTVSKSVLSILFVYFLWRFDSFLPEWFHHILAKLADFSFGIYFLYAYIMYTYLIALKYLNTDISTIFKSYNFIVFVSLLILVMFTNIVTIILAKRFLKGKSKFLVGC